MFYDVDNPKEYLAQLDDDWRKERLLQVRELILEHGPDLEESIEYKMLAYQKNGHSIFNLNAQRAYVSLYVGNISKVGQAKEWLEAFDLGKGCIRIKKKVDIASTPLDQFIQAVIAIWKDGGETDC